MTRIKDTELGQYEQNAKNSFRILGYRRVRDDDDYIIYEKRIDKGQNKKIVDFCKDLKSFRVSFESTTDIPSIDPKLFRAITIQIRELGWEEFIYQESEKDMLEKYHSIERDGLPEREGRYMVKILMPTEPEYDNIEICFRQFVNGEFVSPYYTNPKTDKLIGWYE